MNSEAISTVISLGLLLALLSVLVSLAVFIKRTRATEAISAATRYALRYFGGACLVLSLMIVMGRLVGVSEFVTTMGAAFLVLTLTSELHVLRPSFSVRTGRLSVAVLLVILAVEYVLARLSFLHGVILAQSLLILLAIACFVGALRAVFGLPSVFSGSLVALISLFPVTYLISIEGSTSPVEIFPVQIFPLALMGAVLGSLRQPRRVTILLFLITYLVSVCLSIFLVSLFVPTIGDFSVWLVVGFQIFAIAALLLSTDYFFRQAASSGSRTPAYLGAGSAGSALVLIMHSLVWMLQVSIRFDPTLAGSLPYLEWFVVVTTAVTISCFFMAYVNVALSAWWHVPSIVVSTMIPTAISVVALPFVAIAGLSATAERLLVNGAVTFGVILSFPMMMYVFYRFSKRGAQRAAQRLVLFQLSAFIMIVVSVWSSQIGFDLLLAAIYFFGGLFTIAASPWFVARVQRAVRRLDELSELGVTEDGAIRW